MKTLIENDILAVESKTQGAELTSIRMKASGAEYLWQADPAFWPGQSPVLFPFVCSVADNKYIFKGKQYEMQNHGFARKSEFELATCSPSSATYRLIFNEETYQKFPFQFTLEIGYALHANALEVRYAVGNEDSKEMYFSIGAHPAFNCPLEAGQSFEDYYLEFSDAETIDRQFVNSENLLIAGHREPFLRGERIKPLTQGMFAQGAYILDGCRSTSVALKGRKTNQSVTVSFPGFPQLGIWTKPGAPFVCIEPWYGIAEATDFKGDLTQKKGILKLEPGKTFVTEYQIVIA
jgi:galactose mutarotase-like enzyme